MTKRPILFEKIFALWAPTSYHYQIFLTLNSNTPPLLLSVL